mgnify:CR=1 FL=1
MKLYTFAALLSFVALSAIFLTSCASDVLAPPTPFKAGREVAPLQGCVELRKSVEEHNKQNPTNKLEANC